MSAILTPDEIEILVATGLRAGLGAVRGEIGATLDGITLPILTAAAPQLRADLACLNQRDLDGDPHPLVRYLEGAVAVGEAATYARFAGVVRSRIDADSAATHDDLDALDLDGADLNDTQQDFEAIRDFDALGAEDEPTEG